MAKKDGEPCACLGVSDEGETFVASGDAYRHVVGGILFAGTQGQGSLSEAVELCDKHFEDGRIYQTGCGF